MRQVRLARIYDFTLIIATIIYPALSLRTTRGNLEPPTHIEIIPVTTWHYIKYAANYHPHYQTSPNLLS